MPPGVSAILPLAAGHDQRHEHGLIHDEQPKKHKSWNYGSREQQRHAGGHEERPNPEVKTEPKW
jgi:hypothetical protein